MEQEAFESQRAKHIFNQCGTKEIQKHDTTLKKSTEEQAKGEEDGGET